jgi:hypothetical protein
MEHLSGLSALYANIGPGWFAKDKRTNLFFSTADDEEKKILCR